MVGNVVEHEGWTEGGVLSEEGVVRSDVEEPARAQKGYEYCS